MDEEKVYLDEAGLTRVLEKLSGDTVTIPTLLTASFVYDGTNKTPQFSNVDDETMTLIYPGISKNAGSYDAVVSLKNSKTTKWSDGSDEPKFFRYTIDPRNDVPTGISDMSGELLSIIKCNITTYTGIRSVEVSDESVLDYSLDGDLLTITIKSTGSTMLTITPNGDPNNTPIAKVVTISPTSILSLVSWSSGTDAEIVSLISAAYDGKVDLYEDAGWRVGDERTIQLGAIAASGTFGDGSWVEANNHPAQSITMVLMNKGGETVELGDGTTEECKFVVGLKNCLDKVQKMTSGTAATRTGQTPNYVSGDPTWGIAHDTNCGYNAGATTSDSTPKPNSTGYHYGTDIYEYGFMNALPSTLRSAFKKFHVVAGALDNTWVHFTNLHVNDRDRYEYYKTQANRIKKLGETGNVTDYHLRGGNAHIYQYDPWNKAYRVSHYVALSSGDVSQYYDYGYYGPPSNRLPFEEYGMCPHGCI